LNELWHSRLPLVSKSNISRSGHAICFGAEYENRWYATAIWTDPIARMLNGKDYIELRRLAIAPDAPQNTASRMLKVMRLLLVKRWPQLTKLISYQDTEVHTGTIYAAAGWKPTQRSSVSTTGWNTRKRNKMQTTADKIRWEYDLKGGGK